MGEECSVCGGLADEVEETYPESGNFILVIYRCRDCGHLGNISAVTNEDY